MLFWRRRHPIRDEELSAYVDGQLDAAAGARLEAHIESCAACRDMLTELRAVRAALAALPRSSAPRSFALREEDVRPRASAGAFATLGVAPALLGGVATVALVAFVVLVGIDVTDESSGGAGGTRSSFGAQTLADASEESADGDIAAIAPEPRGAEATVQDDLSSELGGDGEIDEAREDQNSLVPPAEKTQVLGFDADLVTEADDGPNLRLAEAAAAAVALVAGGSLALVWWRRRA